MSLSVDELNKCCTNQQRLSVGMALNPPPYLRKQDKSPMTAFIYTAHFLPEVPMIVFIWSEYSAY